MNDKVEMSTRLRRVALELFAEKGVAATSLQTIATRLGVTKAAVYYHYRTKGEIVRATLAPAITNIESITKQAQTMKATTERQRFLIDALADQAVSNRRLYSVLFQDLTVLQIIDEDSALTQIFDELRKALSGSPEDESPAARLRADIFLSGLVAPTRLPIDDHTDDFLRTTVAESGYRLILGSAS